MGAVARQLLGQCLPPPRRGVDAMMDEELDLTSPPLDDAGSDGFPSKPAWTSHFFAAASHCFAAAEAMITAASSGSRKPSASRARAAMRMRFT